jgi:iron(III) transport system permease protein
MRHLSLSKIISLLTAIVLAVPILIIFTSYFNIDSEIWSHLKTYVLPKLILNTFKLVIGVVCGTLLLGIPLAYINAFYQYPGRRFFSFMALMPMSIPAYIMAFVYIALFDVTGIWSLQIRQWLGMTDFLPGIRNIFGISFVLSLCFYPYVYLLAKNAFESQGMRSLEVSSVMGITKTKTFFKVLIPLSRPWIFSGLLLVLMETMADFGAVSIFNYTTFTTAIYRSWFGLFSLSSAMQLASILVGGVFILLLVEKFLERKKRYNTIGKSGSFRRQSLGLKPSIIVILFSSIVSLFAFFIPLLMIIKWSLSVIDRDLDARYFMFVFNSLHISVLGVLTLLIFGIVMAYAIRKYPGTIAEILKSVSSLGYAVPGTVLAVGVFVFLSKIENIVSPGQKFLTGSLAALVIGLSIRFYSIALAPLSNAFLRISDSHFSIMALTKISKFKKIYKVLIPMTAPGIFTAALMVFVEIMKEMPITLMTRPFGKETLSIRIFEMTSEGEWERAALPSLFLIFISLIPTIILFIQSEKSDEK